MWIANEQLEFMCGKKFNIIHDATIPTHHHELLSHFSTRVDAKKMAYTLFFLGFSTYPQC